MKLPKVLFSTLIFTFRFLQGFDPPSLSHFSHTELQLCLAQLCEPTKGSKTFFCLSSRMCHLHIGKWLERMTNKEYQAYISALFLFPGFYLINPSSPSCSLMPPKADLFFFNTFYYLFSSFLSWEGSWSYTSYSAIARKWKFSNKIFAFFSIYSHQMYFLTVIFHLLFQLKEILLLSLYYIFSFLNLFPFI